MKQKENCGSVSRNSLIEQSLFSGLTTFMMVEKSGKRRLKIRQ